jgi:hypothetical protein
VLGNGRNTKLNVPEAFSRLVMNVTSGFQMVRNIQTRHILITHPMYLNISLERLCWALSLLLMHQILSHTLPRKLLHEVIAMTTVNAVTTHRLNGTAAHRVLLVCLSIHDKERHSTSSLSNLESDFSKS